MVFARSRSRGEMITVTVVCMKDINEFKFTFSKMSNCLSTYRIAISRGT